jgi:hypothetical protein
LPAAVVALIQAQGLADAHHVARMDLDTQAFAKSKMVPHPAEKAWLVRCPAARPQIETSRGRRQFPRKEPEATSSALSILGERGSAEPNSWGWSGEGGEEGISLAIVISTSFLSGRRPRSPPPVPLVPASHFPFPFPNPCQPARFRPLEGAKGRHPQV